MIWAQREGKMDSCRAKETQEWTEALILALGVSDLKAGKHSIQVYTLASQGNSLIGVVCHSLNLQLRDRQWHHCNSLKKAAERHAALRSSSFGHWDETASLWNHLVLRPGLLMGCQLPPGHTTFLDVGVCFLWNRLLLRSPGWPWTCILPNFISQDHRCAAPHLVHPWHFTLSRLTCSMASRGLRSESKLQPPSVRHPLTLRSPPLDAGLFLYEDWSAFSLDISLLGISSALSLPFQIALALPAQTLS